MSIAKMFEAGIASARQEQTRSGLAKLLQGDQSALPQVYANDPAAAAGALKFQGDQREQLLSEFGKMSTLYAKTRDPQVYGRWAQLGKQAKLLPAEAPDALTDPADIDGSVQFASKVASAWGAMGSQTPTGYRQFELQAQAAGLEPGTPEYQRAARVALGTEGRASSAGFGFEMIKGADGRERMGRKNPRTGAFEVYDESTGDFVQMGGAAVGAPAAAPPASIPGVYIDPNLPPFVQQQIAAAEQSGRPVPETITGNAYVSQPTRPASNPRLGVSRAPEEQAAATTAATEQAKIDAFLANAGTVAQAEARAAGMKAGAEATAKTGAEVDAKAGARARDAQQTLSLLDEAEKLLPQATGSRFGAMADEGAAFVGQSTRGAEATDSLKLIAAELVAKVPRFEGPQSNIDVQFYREAAGDLANPNLPVARRMAALQTMRRLRQKYAGQSGGDATRSPATGGWGIRPKGN